jgi:hypothetical protein
METNETSELGAELTRLQEQRDGKAPWRKWGPYLTERRWGTVREDYSANGDAWNYFSHDNAQYRAYRWGEDGLVGSPTTGSSSASPWRCGMDAIRS